MVLPYCQKSLTDWTWRKSGAGGAFRTPSCMNSPSRCWTRRTLSCSAFSLLVCSAGLESGASRFFFFADVLIRREARAGAAEEEVEEGKRGGKEGRQEEDRMEEGRQVLLRSNVARFLASFMRAPWTFRAGVKLLRAAEMLLLSSFVVTQVFLEECRLGVLWTFRGGTKISGSAGMLLPCPFVDTSVASRCRLSVLLRSREERESHARRGCYCIPPSQKHK